MQEKILNPSDNSFDAKTELEKVRNLGEEHNNLPKEEKLIRRKEKLEEFKKNLANQMIGCAEINAGLEKMALSSEKIDAVKMKEYLKETASVYKLTPMQITEYKTLINKLAEKNQLVNEYFDKNCKEKSEEKIFEEIFGKKPSGEIIIEKKPLSLVMICNDEDFAYLLASVESNIIEQNKREDKTKGRAENYFGIAINFSKSKNIKPIFSDIGNTLIVVKKIKDGEEKMIETLVHEEKHIFDMLVLPDEITNIIHNMNDSLMRSQEEVKKISDEKLNNMTTEEYIALLSHPFDIQFNTLRKISEATAKKEILAFYKGGRSSYSIYNRLFDSDQGRGYAVIDENTRQQLSDAFLETAPEIDEKKPAHELFIKICELQEKIYVRHLRSATDAMDDLEKNGLSRGEIIGLFQTEPLERWGNIFKRIQFSDKHAFNKYSQDLKICSADIETYNKDLEETQEQIKHPDKNSHYYKYWVNTIGKKGDMKQYKEHLALTLQKKQVRLDGLIKREEELKLELEKFKKE